MTTCKHYIPMWMQSAGFAPNSVSYVEPATTLRTGFLVDKTKYKSGAKWYLEAHFKAINASTNHTYIKLVKRSADSDLTGATTDVTSATVEATTTTTARYVSAEITSYVSTGDYIRWMAYQQSASGTVCIYNVFLVVIEQDVELEWPNTEDTVCLLNSVFSTAVNAMTVPTNPVLWQYDSTAYTDPPKVRLVVCAYQSASGANCQIELYDVTNTTSKVTITIGNGDTTPHYYESTEVTLTNGATHEIRVKGNGTQTTYCNIARVALRQATTVSKTRLHYPLASYITSASSTYATNNFMTRYYTSELPTVVNVYREVTRMIASATYTCETELWNYTAAALVGSVETMSIAAYTRFRTTAYTMTDNADYGSRVRRTSTSSTASQSGAYLLIDVKPSAIVSKLSDALTETDAILKRTGDAHVTDTLTETDAILKKTGDAHVTDTLTLTDSPSAVKNKVITDAINIYRHTGS